MWGISKIELQNLKIFMPNNFFKLVVLEQVRSDCNHSILFGAPDVEKSAKTRGHYCDVLSGNDLHICEPQGRFNFLYNPISRSDLVEQITRFQLTNVCSIT